MRKRIFGIKISTLLTAFICLAVAFMIWMIVKYNAEFENTAFCSLPHFLRG